MNYYGRFYRSKCVQVLRHLKRGPGSMGATEVQADASDESERRCTGWGALRKRDPKHVLSLWQLGVTTGGWISRSRMRREFHVRF